MRVMRSSWNKAGLLSLGMLGLICGLLVGGDRSIAQVPTNLVTQAQGDRKAEADRLYNLGVQQTDRNENIEALGSLERSLQLYQELADSVGQMNAIRYQGWAHLQMKKLDQARELFQKSIAIARQIQNRAGEARGITGISAVHEQLKEYDKALETYGQARAIALDLKEIKLEAIVLENMGNTARSAGRFAQEIEYLTRNVEIYRSLKQRSDEAYNLSAIGVAYSQLKNHQQSLLFHQQALTIYTALDRRSNVANTLRNIGLTYNSQKDSAKAASTFEQSLQIYRELKNDRQVATLLNDLGWLYKGQKSYPEAIAAFTQRIDIYTKLDDLPNLGQAWRDLGWVYQDQKEVEKAIQATQTSVDLWQKVKDNRSVDAFLTLGLLHSKQKKYPQSIAAYEQYLAGMRQRPKFKEEALILKVLGDLYRMRDTSKEHSERALKYYEESLKIAERTRNESDKYHALHGIGMIYMESDRSSYSFQKATEYLEKSLAGWGKLNDQVMEANALTLLGSMYVGAMGNDGKTWCERGTSYLEKGLILQQNLKDQVAETEILNLLAQCYQETGKSQKAIQIQEQSLALSQKNQNLRQEGLSAMGLAKSYRLVGNLAKAEQLAQRGNTILRELKEYKWEVSSLDELSRIYVAMGNPDRAIEAQNRRIVLAYTHDVRLVNYGFNAVMVNIKQAQNFDRYTYRDREEQRLRKQLTQHKLSTKVLDLLGPKVTEYAQPGFFAPATMSGKIGESLTILGDAHVEAKQYAQAIEFYRSALRADHDKGSFGMGDIDLLTKLGDISQRMNRLKESEEFLRLALKYGEEFRTGLGYAKDSGTKKWSDVDRIFLADRKIRNFKQLQQVLVAQNRQTEALETAEEARARTFVELLAARASDRPVGDIMPTAPNVEKIRQVAKNRNATLVQYSIVGDELLYIWVIKPNGEMQFRSTAIPTDQPLKQLVSSSRSEMGVRGRTKIQITPTKPNTLPQTESTGIPSQDNLVKLHRLLIDPIAQDLPTDPDQQVIFIPQDELFLVPFAALPDAQGQYLIQRHTISTAPSIQTLEFTQTLAKRPKTQKGIVVVGDPVMPVLEDNTALAQLPGARQEAINISERLQVKPLLGEAATKAAVLEQMKSAKILHLATHGLLDTTLKDNMPGAIALAPSGRDNGLLSSGEIFDLKLNLDLVVLSACDTGGGKLTGDGVIGLSRSFFAAGSSSVLVSLWAVNDGSTSNLMTEFYNQLQQQPNKAKALRQAMLKTKERSPRPIDWAAFTLIGEN